GRAGPHGAWKGRCRRTPGKASRTRPTRSHTRVGVAIPVVSPSEIDAVPASRHSLTTSRTRMGATSPSYGSPKAEEIDASTGSPAALATAATWARPAIDSHPVLPSVFWL